VDNRLARIRCEHFDLVNFRINLVENFRLVVKFF